MEVDFFEKGLCKVFNFGYMIGYVIEGYVLEMDILFLYGEVIVIGMICEAFFSI